MSEPGDHLSIVLLGASGHLARTKILPALFALYSQGFLPKHFRVVGFARTPLSDAEFRAITAENLTCRYMPEAASCEARMQEFLARCTYVSGQYDATADLKALAPLLKAAPDGTPENRVFYLAVPPHVFLPVTRALGEAGFANPSGEGAWTRVVIEKPFGHDRASSDLLTHEMGTVFKEEQIYRIDHYLGKEVIQNLLVLRFANLIFEPIWNRHYIKSVQITWKENVSIEGRGGYFDGAGIIRDVMQNHLLQILSLVAMEPPSRLNATHIRNAKVNALQCVPPPTLDDVVVGQYAATYRGGVHIPGYRDDPSVLPGSRTATYAAAALRVVNGRWEGVPFLLRAGKGLDGRSSEIRIQFRPAPGGVFPASDGTPNELVIRIQPDEAITFRIWSKVPGLGMDLELRELNLQYKTAFTQLIPEAYEDLLLDILRGEKSLFIREDELASAWDIFTPVLETIDAQSVIPEAYEFGTAGPAGADQLAARHGAAWHRE
ncbi:MAG: glucose-6-phosphate dehydrogenase [Verrucomicrobia bacterium]|nr:glucose-6-phosphate dehydrogenase [Verrucomicrobiota bacterium]